MVADDTVKIVHVLSASLFLGNVVVSGTWAALAERTRNYEVIAFSNRLVLVTDLLFTLTGAVLYVDTLYPNTRRHVAAASLQFDAAHRRGASALRILDAVVRAVTAARLRFLPRVAVPLQPDVSQLRTAWPSAL